jgi:hypothetical protein
MSDTELTQNEVDCDSMPVPDPPHEEDWTPFNHTPLGMLKIDPSKLEIHRHPSQRWKRRIRGLDLFESALGLPVITYGMRMFYARRPWLFPKAYHGLIIHSGTLFEAYKGDLFSPNFFLVNGVMRVDSNMVQGECWEEHDVLGLHPAMPPLQKTW